MPTLTLNIRMHDKLAVIIGGGNVALRKLRTLLKSGARVRLVARDIMPEIVSLKDAGLLDVRVGGYAMTDLDDAFLVIAATDNALINGQVCSDARQRGVLVAAAGNSAGGDCMFPAVLQRGDLEIAVSTDGLCPAFAVEVRDEIAGHIGHEYGAILDQLAKEREKLLTNENSSTYNKQVLRSIARRLAAEFTESKESLP